MRAGAGTWHRSLTLPAGGRLEERGLLPDSFPAAVIQWTWHPDRTEGPQRSGSICLIDLRLHLDPPHAPLELRLLLGENSPVTVALLPETSDEAAAERSLGPLAARERLRVTPREEEGIEIFLEQEGSLATRPLHDALLAIEEASLSLNPQRTPTGPFLAGIIDGAPTFFSGAALAELGQAALGAGRFELARGVLDALASDPTSDDGDLDRLTAQWIDWTGEPRRPRSTSGSGKAPSGSLLAAPRQVLPVLQGSPKAPQIPPRKGLFALPPSPQDFGNPDLPAFAPRRTIHAARLIRAWVERALGIQPDAAVGRLRLGPEIPVDWVSLRVTGIRMGDASVTLEFRREPRKTTFLLRQDAGRVPIHVVFEPLLPLDRVSSVRIADSIADVGLVPEGPGLRLSCQFPLDPERRVTIVA